MSLYNQSICHSGQRSDTGIRLVHSLRLPEKRKRMAEQGGQARRDDECCLLREKLHFQSQICHKDDSSPLKSKDKEGVPFFRPSGVCQMTSRIYFQRNNWQH